MKFKDYVSMSFGDLKKRKFRTFLTSFAVAIGTMLIIVMVSMGIGLKKEALKSVAQNSNMKDIQLFAMEKEKPKNNGEYEGPKFKKIEPITIDKIRKINSVDSVQSSLTAKATIIKIDGKTKNSVDLIGRDLNYDVYSKNELEQIRTKEKNKGIQFVSSGEELKKENTEEALVGEKLLKNMGIKDTKSVIGKEINITAEMPVGSSMKAKAYTVNLKIVGVINEKFKSSDAIVTSIESVGKVNSYYTMTKDYLKEKGPDTLIISAKNVKDIEKIDAEIGKLGYRSMSYTSIAKQVNSVFAVLEVVLAVGGIIVLFVASLGVINTMTMSIYERTRSIGIMKAVGASKRNIKNVFIVESGAIGFIGGIVGTLLGYINIEIIGLGIQSYLKSKGAGDAQIFSTPIWLIAGSIGFSILISVLAGLYPSHKAAKLDPIDALRYE